VLGAASNYTARLTRLYSNRSKSGFFVLPAVMLELEKVYTNSEFVSVDPGTHMMAME
jgi:hypothetical protein